MFRGHHIRDFLPVIKEPGPSVFTAEPARIPLLLTLTILTLLPTAVSAQGTMGSRTLALGQTTAALEDDRWAVFHNMARLKPDQPALSVYAMRFAGFAELTDMAAVFTVPVQSAGLSGGVHHYGFDLFSETRFMAGYKSSLDRFHFGFVTSYHHVRQGGNYGSAGAIGMNAGIAAEIDHRLTLGARAVNLNRPAYGENEELARELVIGVSYRMSDKAMITGDLVKDVRYPLSVRSGLELWLLDRVAIRTGVTTAPVTWSLGLGLSLPPLDVSIAVQRHEVLGLSPGIEIGLDFPGTHPLKTPGGAD